jgi:hypothetical protein
MKTSSAKAKGRRFQQWVRDQLIESLNVHVVFIKRNNQKPLVVVDAEYFVKLHEIKS